MWAAQRALEPSTTPMFPAAEVGNQAQFGCVGAVGTCGDVGVLNQAVGVEAMAVAVTEAVDVMVMVVAVTVTEEV